MKWNRLVSGVAVLMVALSLAPLAVGADYPTKEINYIVAFNPGGESDIEFRLMQPFLEKAFGVRFAPEYKPAAGGALAWGFLSGCNPGRIHPRRVQRAAHYHPTTGHDRCLV